MEQKETYLYIVGISHKTSTVAEREKYQIGRMDLPQALNWFFCQNGVEGISIVTTCNRLEFYLVMVKNFNPIDVLKKYYFTKEVDVFDFDRLFYLKESIDAARHLFRVISGMESLILGEYQIQGQVKEAYSVACEAKTCEKVLHKLFHAAFRAGKSVRTSTSLGSGKQSVSGAASQIMLAHLKKSDTITIIGVNENTKLLAGEMKEAGFPKFIFVNRTLYKAGMLADQYGGKAASLDEVAQALAESDALFSCTGAPGSIISSDLLNSLALQNRCPSLIVDMAVPRDIDNHALPVKVKYFDIGNLHDYLSMQTKAQLEAIPFAEKLIQDEVLLFQAWTESQSYKILEPYAEKFELIRQDLLKEYQEQLSEKSFEKLDRFSRSLVHRMQSTFVRALINNKEK
jgi:glutamyl-tRNA reductase